MAFREYGNYDGIGLADLVRKKQVSAAELLDEAIARTAKVDPEINAVVVKHYDYARRQIDRGLPDGPFTGVPFLLKDLDLLETTRTTFGASVFKENVAMRFMGPKCRAPMSHRRRRGLFRRRADAIQAGCPLPLPTGRLMAMPSIPRLRHRFVTSLPCWRASAIMSRNGRRNWPPIRQS